MYSGGTPWQYACSAIGCGLPVLWTRTPKKVQALFSHFIPESDLMYPVIKESLNYNRNKPEISDIIS